MGLKQTRSWHSLAAIGALAIVYFGLSHLIFRVPLQGFTIWPLWIPAGLAQTVLLLYGRNLFPGIAIGSFLFAVSSSEAVGLSAVSALNDTLQAWMGATLLRRYGFSPRLESRRDVIGLFTLAAILPACFSATVGVLKLSLWSRYPWTQFGLLWFDWWISNVTGVLTLMPMLLTLKQWRAIAVYPRKFLEAGVWLSLLMLISWFVFYSSWRLDVAPYPLEYLPFPLLIWGSLRFGQPGATLAIAVVTNIATWGVTQGISPFLKYSTTPIQAVQSLQAYICVIALTAMMMAAIMAERQEAQQQTENLLLKILPSPIADRLKNSQQTIADHFPEVTVLFADIVNFTRLSARLSPQELVALLNEIFSAFDHLAEKHGLEKIKTIGDAYMVVGGIPYHQEDHARAIAEMALDMQIEIATFRDQHHQPFDMRIGINTGPVIAGVIGTKKFLYDLWGDTVNIASRMESQGLKGHIQVTEETYTALKNYYQFEPRGEIQVKGRGVMMTYFLKGRLYSTIAEIQD